MQIMNGQSYLKDFVPTPGGGAEVYTPSINYYRHADWLGSSRFASSPAQGVLNPGFETGNSQGWITGFDGTNVFVTSSQAQSGTYSLAQNGSTGGSYQIVPGLVTGQSYQVSVWVLADPGSTSQMSLVVDDTNGGNEVQSSQFTPGTTWQQVTVSFTADSTDEMRIILWYYSGSGTIYYDSVSVSPAPSGSTMYFDTAYAPFGEPYGWDGTTDFSFTGMNQDTAYDLYDFPAREYSNVGRWISPDPAGLAAVDPTNPQSWNRYAYALNSPCNLVDPSGLAPTTCTLNVLSDSPLGQATEQVIQNIFKQAGIAITFDFSQSANISVQTNIGIPGALGSDPNLGATVQLNNVAIGSMAMQLAGGDAQGAFQMGTQAAGVVVAHEMGHFLLQQGHPDVGKVGIMRPGNEQGTLPFYMDMGGLQRFTPQQARMIRKRCKNLQSKRSGGGGSCFGCAGGSGGGEWVFWSPILIGAEGNVSFGAGQWIFISGPPGRANPN